MVQNEFQAVILAAGRGSRMSELTAGIPKCLLPVGSKPILYYVLKTLEKAGLRDAMVLVLEHECAEIQQSLTHNSLSISYELISIPSDSEDWGTADSLVYLLNQDKIKTDVLLVTCDLFTNSTISELLNTYRKYKASFAALFFYPVQTEPFQVPGLKSKYKPEKDIIGIDLDTSRLIFLASASDFEENVYISRNILNRYPRFNLRTDLIDGHFYVLSYKLIEYMTSKKTFSTLKGEFFPHIVSKQHKSMHQNLGNDKNFNVNESSKKSLYEFVRETKLEENIMELSAYNDHKGDLKKVYHGDALKCYAVMADPDKFGIRINSLQTLCQANRLCMNGTDRVEAELIGTRINPSATIESNQVDSVSFIGTNSKIKEKTSIKSSVIGDGCIVNPKTRITNCLVLQNVEIREGCVLDNCIIANDAIIGSGCDLKNCLVESKFFVADATKAISQVLTESQNLMEI